MKHVLLAAALRPEADKDGALSRDELQALRQNRGRDAG